METTHKIWVVDVIHMGARSYLKTTRHIFTSRAPAVEFLANVRRGTPRLGSGEGQLPAQVDWSQKEYATLSQLYSS